MSFGAVRGWRDRLNANLGFGLVAGSRNLLLRSSDCCYGLRRRRNLLRSDSFHGRGRKGHRDGNVRGRNGSGG